MGQWSMLERGVTRFVCGVRVASNESEVAQTSQCQPHQVPAITRGSVVLSDTELATIRAALRFWKDEIVPSGIATAKPYFDQNGVELLKADEVDQLIASFEQDAVLVIRWNNSGHIVSRPIRETEGEATAIFGRDG